MNAYPMKVVACLAAGGWLALAAAQETVSQEPAHARVSFDSGKSMVKGTNDAEWTYATLNSLVVPGDTLWIDREGTFELELPGGAFLRMADESKAEMVDIGATNNARLWKGSAYVQRPDGCPAEVVIETPVCQVAAARDSQVRIDVLGNGATTVSVRWGAAIVHAEGGQDVALTRGQQSWVDPGYLPTAPAPFDVATEDDFDSWHRERTRLLAAGADSVPSAVAIAPTSMGAADLAAYGQWILVDSSYYWQPTAVADYVPYRYGHWSYLPGCGYAWIGDYPFCYLTSHYGRWWHHDVHGWLWTYRDTWGPAWVSGLRYGPDFVWTPLDPWDRPCSYGGYLYTAGDFRFGVGGSSYCGMEELLAGPCAVRPCTPAMVRGVPPVEVCAWDLHAGAHARPPRPQGAPGLEVRAYPPRRIVRGPEAPAQHPGGGRAPDRVATLEHGTPPLQWRHAGGGAPGPLPPRADGPVRVAQPRPAKIQHELLQNGGRPVLHSPHGDRMIAGSERPGPVRSIRIGSAMDGAAGSFAGPDVRPQGTGRFEIRRTEDLAPIRGAGGSPAVTTPRRDPTPDVIRVGQDNDPPVRSLWKRMNAADTKGSPAVVAPSRESRQVAELTRPVTPSVTRHSNLSTERTIIRTPDPSPRPVVPSQPKVIRADTPKAASPEPAPVRHSEPLRLSGATRSPATVTPQVRSMSTTTASPAPIREPVRAPRTIAAPTVIMPAPAAREPARSPQSRPTSTTLASAAPVREPLRVSQPHSIAKPTLPAPAVREPARAPQVRSMSATPIAPQPVRAPVQSRDTPRVSAPAAVARAGAQPAVVPGGSLTTKDDDPRNSGDSSRRSRPR